jgi:hypothetical protein
MVAAAAADDARYGGGGCFQFSAKGDLRFARTRRRQAAGQAEIVNTVDALPAHSIPARGAGVIEMATHQNHPTATAAQYIIARTKKT